MHVLYTGVSLSGKTTLARMFARQFAAQKHRGFVFDPVNSQTAGGGWPAEFPIIQDREQFLAMVEAPEFVGPVHLFVDEGHELFGHGMDENFWLLTRGRHYGLFLHVMTQRPPLLHPSARSQLHKAFMFRLAQDDVIAIGKDYGHNGLHKISLDRGDFLVMESGTSSIGRGNVFQLVQPSGVPK